MVKKEEARNKKYERVNSRTKRGIQHFAISTEKMVAGEKNTTLRGKAKNEKGGKNGRKLHKKR